MNRIAIRLVIFVGFLLAGCGGSGTSTVGEPPTVVESATVSGVAAAGAPVSGTVTLVDKNGVQRVAAIDGSGGFVIDASGLALPFVLKAEGQAGGSPQKLYAVTNHAGTVHVNPYTTLIFFVALGDDPAQFFASAVSRDGSKLSDALLSQAQQSVRAFLQPLLALYGITDFNPRTGAYAAQPGNRLDAMLDVVGIAIDSSGTLVLSNKLNGAVLSTGSVANLAGLNLDTGKTPDAACLDDLVALTERLAQLTTLLNSGTDMTRPAVEAFFIADPDYGTSSNQTRTQNVDSIFTVWGVGGLNTDGKLKSIRNLRLVQDLTADYGGRGVSRAYLLTYDFIFESGKIVHGNNVTFAKEQGSGAWKFIGDPLNSNLGDNFGCVSIMAIDIVYTSNYGDVIYQATIPASTQDGPPATEAIQQ